MDNVNLLNNEELKTSISRLAHFSPSIKDDHGHQIIDYLVLDSLAASGSLFKLSPEDVRGFIKKHVLLDFDESEIVESAKRLATKKQIKIEFNERFNEVKKMQIMPHIEHEISVRRSEMKSLEERVLQQWRDQILLKYVSEEIVKLSIDKVIGSLQLFLSKMFVKHGVDSVSILYPDDKKAQKWVETLDKTLTDFLPGHNEFINSIVKIEIAEFLKSIDHDRKAYLANLFNASFYWHLIQVDETGSQLLKTVTKGQKLILDNNIIYNIVGIAGETMLIASHRLLKMAKDLGYDLVVTTKSIDEFQSSLKWQMKEFQQRLPLPSALAKIAVQKLGADNFVTVYWKNLAEKKVTIEEFVAETSHVDDILAGLDIEIMHKYQKDIEGSEELSDEMNKLKQACGDHFNDHIVEHDAFHRILIRKLRKGNKYNFNDAKAWFLTQDSKLPKYSRYARKGEEYLPFCLTTNQWIQLNRPFLARTRDQAEYEQSLTTLITQPFLRHILPKHPLQEAYNRVLGRLGRYENASPDLASQMTTDIHFMLSVSAFEDGDKNVELDTQIDNKITEANKELRQKIESLILENKAAEKTIAKLESRIDGLDEKVKKTASEVEEKEFQSEQTRSILTEKEQLFNQSIQKHIQENDKLKIELENLKAIQTEIAVSKVLKKWRQNSWFYFSGGVIVIMLAIAEALPANDFNLPSKFVEWVDALQSETKKNLFMAINVSVITGLSILCFLKWFDRLLNKKKIEQKKKEILEEMKNPAS
jgi:hypothetical protein